MMIEESRKNDELLELIHLALKKWKKSECVTQRYGDIYFLKQKNLIRTEALKNIYMTLLQEAKQRRLSLSSEQLLDRILTTGDEIQDMTY